MADEMSVNQGQRDQRANGDLATKQTTHDITPNNATPTCCGIANTPDLSSVSMITQLVRHTMKHVTALVYCKSYFCLADEAVESRSPGLACVTERRALAGAPPLRGTIHFRRRAP